MLLNTTSMIIVPIFLSQLAVVSLYAPFGRERYYGELLRRHPIKAYPLLYPSGTAHWDFQRRVLRLLHLPIALGGFLALAYALINSASNETLSDLLVGCLLIQLLPWFLAIYWDLREERAFKFVPRPNVREAELTPRKLKSLISPWAIVLAVGLYLITAGMAMYAAFDEPQAWGQFSSMAIASAVLLGLIYWYFHKFMRTARNDPYELNDEYWAKARRSMRLIVLAVASASIVNLAGLIAHTANWPLEYDLYGRLIVSLLMQVVLIIENRWLWHQLDDKDFSVYRVTSNQ